MENEWDNIAGEMKFWRIFLFLFFSGLLVGCASPDYNSSGMARLRDANYNLQMMQQQEQMRSLQRQQQRAECLQRQQDAARYSNRAVVNVCY